LLWPLGAPALSPDEIPKPLLHLLPEDKPLKN